MLFWELAKHRFGESWGEFFCFVHLCWSFKWSLAEMKYIYRCTRGYSCIPITYLKYFSSLWSFFNGKINLAYVFFFWQDDLHSLRARAEEIIQENEKLHSQVNKNSTVRNKEWWVWVCFYVMYKCVYAFVFCAWEWNNNWLMLAFPQRILGGKGEKKNIQGIAIILRVITKTGHLVLEACLNLLAMLLSQDW